MTDNLSDNELIARFHGWTHVPTPKGKGDGYWNFPEWHRAQFNSDALQYHKSWDWLMPVVEKIEAMTQFAERPTIEIIGRACFIYASPKNGKRKWIQKTFSTGATKITKTYDAVVEFIKWYNETKPV